MKKRIFYFTLILGFLISLPVSQLYAAELNTKESITINTIAGSDDEYLVSASFQGDGGTEVINNTDNLDLILILDTSGSMSGKKINDAKTNAKSFANKILVNPNNQISVIGFSTTPTNYISLNNSITNTNAAIDSISVSGGTSLHKGITAADAELTANGRSNSKKVIVILSDGVTSNMPASKTTMNALIANHGDVTIKTIGYDIISASNAENHLIDLANLDPLTGNYYNASIDDLNKVFDNIHASLLQGFENVDITGIVPENFTIVEGSLNNPDNITFDMNKFANNEISGNIKNTDPAHTYTFSYRIKINQAVEKTKGKTIELPHSFTYTNTDTNNAPISKVKQLNTSSPIYLINTKTDGNGSISDSRYVVKGANYTVTWQPEDGYSFKGIRIDNTTNTTASKAYSITNIQADHDVEVSFSKNIMAPSTGDTTNKTLLLLSTLVSGICLVAYFTKKYN